MMSIYTGYTLEQIRETVHEYNQLRHGTKTAWIKKQSFTEGQLRGWRKAFIEGDLERHLIPRDDGLMGEPRLTPRQLAIFEKARVKEIAEHEAEVARLKEQVRQLEGANTALGKAIGLLHELHVPEPARPTTPPDSPRS